MSPKRDRIERRWSLREKSEAMVASLAPEKTKAQPAEVLLHELLVHKIELEMQNDELQRTHTALEEARDRYKDLYEFAPTGYFIIDHEDHISETNLTGAALLGIDRNKLTKLRFSKFVAPDSRDHWYRQFRNMMDAAKPEKQALDFEMLRSDDFLFHAHLDCLRRCSSADSPPILLVALTNIEKINPALNNYGNSEQKH